MKCWFCGKELIWNNDFSFEDYELEGEGIVMVLSCPNCGCSWYGLLQEGEDENEC